MMLAQNNTTSSLVMLNAMWARGSKWYRCFGSSIRATHGSSGLIREEKILEMGLYIFLCPSNTLLIVDLVQDGSGDGFNTSCLLFKEVSRQRRKSNTFKYGSTCTTMVFSHLSTYFWNVMFGYTFSCSFILSWLRVFPHMTSVFLYSDQALWLIHPKISLLQYLKQCVFSVTVRCRFSGIFVHLQ